MSLTFDFERYLNIRSAYTPVWLAGGRRVGFLTDITGTPQVWAVDVAGGWPDQLSFFQDKVWTLDASPSRGRGLVPSRGRGLVPSRGRGPVPSGDRLICARDVGGNECYQLFLVSGDGTEVRRLTDDDEAIFHFGGWSHDGRRIAYASNVRDGVHFDVYVQAVDGGKPVMVFEGDGNFRALAWSPDDSQLILCDEVSSARQSLYLLELAGGRVRSLTPEDGPVSHRQVRWAADGYVYLLTDRDRDFKSLVRLDVASGQMTCLADHNWDVESLAVSPDALERTRTGARNLAYTVNVEGYSRFYLHDLTTGQARQVPGLPRGVVTELVFSPCGKQVAMSVQSPQRNLNIWIVEVDTLACRQLTRSSLAGIPQDSLVEPELIHYETFDGRPISAFFYRPRGVEDWCPRGVEDWCPPDVEPLLPVILYVHGGPASQTVADFDPRFQYFLGQGYAILAPNVRGSSGFGKAYMALDDVRRRMDSVADLKYAVEWLRTSGIVDPDRIAIYGRSYGGFMVLAAVTTYPDLWAAAVDVVGIANWVTFLENTGPWRRAHREREYGSLERDRDFLEGISPLYQVDRIRCPLLVVHGANDPRVPVTEAEQMVDRLGSRGHPVEYLCYEDEGHKISKLGNRIDSFTKMADFLERYL